MTDSKTTALGTHFGPYRIDTRGNKIVAVRGHEFDPYPSPIGQAFLHSNELRIMRPAIRQSWLEEGPGSRNEFRGSEAFVEVEWDEAIGLASSELKRVHTDYGPESVFAGSYGWGSAGRVHAPSALLFRLLLLNISIIVLESFIIINPDSLIVLFSLSIIFKFKVA